MTSMRPEGETEPPREQPPEPPGTDQPDGGQGPGGPDQPDVEPEDLPGIAGENEPPSSG